MFYKTVKQKIWQDAEWKKKSIIRFHLLYADVRAVHSPRINTTHYGNLIRKSFVHVSYVDACSKKVHSIKSYIEKDHNIENNHVKALKTTALKNEEKIWKFVLSPQDGHKLDLHAYTERFMERIQKRTVGTIFYFYSVHKDTDNPHVHIALRGVTSEGAKIHFTGDDIRKRLRSISNELITKQIGYKSRIEFFYEKKEEERKLCYTELDRILFFKSNRNALLPFSLGKNDPLHVSLYKRIKFLRHLGLCTRNGAYKFSFHPETKSKLQALGAMHERTHICSKRLPQKDMYGYIIGTNDQNKCICKDEKSSRKYEISPSSFQKGDKVFFSKKEKSWSLHRGRGEEFTKNFLKRL